MLYSHGWHNVLCTVCSSAVIVFCSMSNIDEFGFLGEGFDQEEEMDIIGPVDPGIIDVQTSKSEQEDLGEYLEDGSSVHKNSSNPPARWVVPFVGSVGGQTGIEVPQPEGQGPPSMHTSSSVSNMHNVGTIATAGLRKSAEPPVVALQVSSALH